MVPESNYVFYISYFLASVLLGVVYVRLQALQPMTITTREFKNFQSRFFAAYLPLMLCELISTAFFFWLLTAKHLTVSQSASMFVCAQISTTACNFVVETFDVMSRRTKCLTSCALYLLSSLSMLSSNCELIMLGRVLEGCASALFHTAFEAYIINEHAVNGFPDDWLSQTFSLIGYAMSMCAVMCGVTGAFSRVLLGYAGPPLLGAALAGWALFNVALQWPKDTHTPKFALTQFMGSIVNTLAAASTNKPLTAILAIQACFESTIIIITFYWAPYLKWEVMGSATPPPGVVFATLTAAAATGSFAYQIYSANPNPNPNPAAPLQWVLICAGGCFIVAAMGAGPSLALLCIATTQACVGIYWPCIGYLRGKFVPFEFRSSSMILTRAAAVIITTVVLQFRWVLEVPLLTLGVCACLCGCGVYLHSQTEASHMHTSAHGNELKLEEDDL